MHPTLLSSQRWERNELPEATLEETVETAETGKVGRTGSYILEIQKK